MTMKAKPYAARLMIAVLGISLSLALASCVSPEQKAASTITDQQFATDWREHSRPLIYRGMGYPPATSIWMVPTILPNGSYRVIDRQGDGATMIDGYRFTIESDPEKEIHLLLPSEYHQPEALEEKYILGLNAGASQR
jgi:hypothetical protein